MIYKGDTSCNNIKPYNFGKILKQQNPRPIEIVYKIQIPQNISIGSSSTLTPEEAERLEQVKERRVNDFFSVEEVARMRFWRYMHEQGKR